MFNLYLCLHLFGSKVNYCTDADLEWSGSQWFYWCLSSLQHLACITSAYTCTKLSYHSFTQCSIPLLLSLFCLLQTQTFLLIVIQAVGKRCTIQISTYECVQHMVFKYMELQEFMRQTCMYFILYAANLKNAIHDVLVVCKDYTCSTIYYYVELPMTH